MKRIEVEALVAWGAGLLAEAGMSQEQARRVATVIVEAEAFRETTHGLAQLKVVLADLKKGSDAQATPRIERQQGSMCLIDGEGCVGILTMDAARGAAIAAAREHGVGFATVRNTQWIGALGAHLIAVGREGLLALAWAQTNTCRDCAPFGGRDARFSTNPIALTFPTDGDPVLADFSTATMSMGAANALITAGKETACPRFLDKDGNATADPAVIKDEGTLMFTGGETEGHKGFALSLFIEAMTVLAGGSANNPALAMWQSFGLIVFDPAAFAGADYYRQEMRRFLEHVMSSRPRPGQTVRLPGARGFAALREAHSKGVPLDEGKVTMLNALAAEYGVAGI